MNADDLIRQIQAGAIPDRRGPIDRRTAERRRRHLWNLFIISSVVMGVLFALPRFVDTRRGVEVGIPPDELMGTWTTDDARYADRFLTFTQERLTVGLGDQGRATYPIRSIRVEVAPVHREYIVTYEGEEGDELMEIFVYDDGLMRLKNPSEVQWRRTEE